MGEKPKRLLIGHDGAGRGAGWHLASVSVIRTKVNGKKIADAETVFFNCGYLSGGPFFSAILPMEVYVHVMLSNI